MKKEAIELLPLFTRFVMDSENGKRLKKDGRRIKKETIDNYRYVYANILGFIQATQFVFRIKPYDQLNKKEKLSEKSYWNKFYRQFTDYLYTQKGCHDNYVGSNVKVIRVFFNYLKTERLIATGDFFKRFYVTKEDIPVLVLTREQLQFLIFNKEFRQKIPANQVTTLDIFIIGCTVALRVSDLFNINRTDIQRINSNWYLQNRSIKTGTDIRIRLPDYADNIIRKYATGLNKRKKLFPRVSLNQFNMNLKNITELAGWTDTVDKTRAKRGRPVECRIPGGTKSYRFCDLVSSHIMRRTAVTTMLILGMPEHLVRKISGHGGNSKAFFRYVNYAQAFLDNELSKVHQKLEAGMVW
jgi:integrase